MAIQKPTFGQKELKVLLVTIGAFIAFAISTILWALSRNVILIIPMILFGIITLVSFIFYLTFVLKSAKEETSTKNPEVKPESKKKEPNSIGAKT